MFSKKLFMTIFIICAFMGASTANNHPEGDKRLEGFNMPSFESSSLSFKKILEKSETINHIRSEINNELRMLEQVVSQNPEVGTMTLMKIVTRIKHSFKRLDHSLEEFIPRELIEMLYDTYMNEMNQPEQQQQRADLPVASYGLKQKRSKASSLEFLKKYHSLLQY